MEQLNAVKEALHVSRAPSNLLCREIENNRILEFCKQAVEQEKAGSLYICGCPGTGKSLSIEKVNKVLVNWAEEELKRMLDKTNRSDAPFKFALLFALPALFAFRHDDEFNKFVHCIVDGTWGTIKGSYAYGSELYTGNVNLSKGESSRSRRKIIIGSSVGASALLLATIVLRYLIKVLNDLICEQTPPTFSIVKSFIGKGPLNDGELLIRSLKLIIVIAETLQYKLGMLDLGLCNQFYDIYIMARR
ncbi:Cell division control protein 6 -like protein [Capsicum chinense]|nr:Cell division control protein 6 -like protein [Capsicum chinense]